MIELLGHYGGDREIALAAWTSTSRELTPEKEGRIDKMIHTLWREGHKTPFERGIVHFLVDTDIASHIHMIKHRHAGTNGESARYKEIKEDRIHIPQDWKGDDTLQYWANKLEQHSKEGLWLYHECLEELTPILGRKRAKESSRYFRGYNTVINTDVIMNMSCFANFYYLRASDHAQKEIRDIALEMFRLIKAIPNDPFRHTLKAIEVYRK